MAGGVPPLRIWSVVLLGAAMLGGCSGDDGTLAALEPLPQPTVEIVAEGLVNPLGLAALPDGSILIAEEGTGDRDESAGVSVLTADGRVGRVVSGLPSGRDAGDLSGVPLVGVSPDGSTALLAHFGGGSLLSFPIPKAGLEPESPGNLALQPDHLDRVMLPLNAVQLVNPFDITFDEAGNPVVTDASSNGVAIATEEGETRFFHRFDQLTDPAQPTLQIDAVPTGITRVDDEYYVTLTGGCPYPAGSGKLVAIDLDRNERDVATGLNMPIDVAVGENGTIWVLEFAQFAEGGSCFGGTGYQPGTGRLSRLRPDGTTEALLTDLDFPGAVLPMPDGSLYVTEIFSGLVLHLTWPGDADQAQPDAAIAPAAAPDAVWEFSDITETAGIEFRHGAFETGISDDPAAGMGAGLCWIDFDADGRLDLYLVNSHALSDVDFYAEGAGLPRNTLYRNDGSSFTDAGEGSGADLAIRGNGCVAADFDGDGWSDLYVTADGPNVLLRNNGDGTFTDVAEQAGVAAQEWSSAAVVGDINGDGFPDLFVGSYIDVTKKIDKPSGAFPQDYVGIPDHLYLSTGDAAGISFEDVTTSAGLTREARTLGALFTDLDDDGDLDLYIANDGQPNRLYRNDTTDDQIPSFVDVTDQAGVGDAGSGMGVAGGDYDRDGAFDLLITNWEAELNALYHNESSGGPLTFGYVTHRIGMVGLGNNKTAWGASWADFDHDTDLDFLIVHGRVPVTDLDSDPELIRLYGNQLDEGSPGEFRDWTRDVGLDRVGPLLARGSAVADFDNDGDLDVAVNVIGGTARLLRNDNPPGNWIGVELSGFTPGAIVTAVLPDGTTLRREGHAGSSYLASEDPRFHFGLGTATTADVSVRWPDGTETALNDLPAGAWHQVDRP